MDSDRLNRWLTLIANIGVLAGIRSCRRKVVEYFIVKYISILESRRLFERVEQRLVRCLPVLIADMLLTLKTFFSSDAGSVENLDAKIVSPRRCSLSNVHTCLLTNLCPLVRADMPHLLGFSSRNIWK